MATPATSIRRIPASTPAALRRGAGCALVAAIVLALVAAPASATTYKWTDANGRVIYSDQPPNGNFKVEALSAPPPPANPNAAKELASKEAELQQKKLLRAEEDAKVAKARADADKKRDQCGKVRGQIAVMQSSKNVLYRTNAKGEQEFMDEAARRKERTQLEAWVKENCTP